MHSRPSLTTAKKVTESTPHAILDLAFLAAAIASGELGSISSPVTGSRMISSEPRAMASVRAPAAPVKLFEIVVILRPTVALMLLNILDMPRPNTVTTIDENSINVPLKTFSESEALSNALDLIVAKIAIRIIPMTRSRRVPATTPAIAHFLNSVSLLSDR
jgi:hypothetical protein